MNIKNHIKNNRLNYFTAAAMILLTAYYFASFEFTQDKQINGFINEIVIRTGGGAVFLYLIKRLDIGILKPFRKPFARSLLIALPALAVAVNNLPIIALITGNARVTAPVGHVLIFGLQCSSVGLFEETFFRGIVLSTVWEKAPKSTKGVFFSVIISSAVFGLFHLLNIFVGMNAGEVILQMCYSFLIGAMLSVILFKTGNIWLCVMIHAVYNFCGLIVPTLGEGELWDIPTIIITALLGVAVAVYIIRTALKINPRNVFK
jgi:hypothetical protein